MKKLLILLFILIIPSAVLAKPINTTVYRTMQSSSYRHNYRNNVNNQVMPYWQAQANYSTRNRVYQNYSSYDNTLQQYNNSHQQYRGY